MKPLRMLAMALLLAFGPLARPALATEHVHYAAADLDQMLAPIALYPDSVLSHVLIAATYPLDVAQAARWSRAHPDLEGQDAVDAVEGRDWDASVKALVAFPEILARMDDDLDWTERLGEAFLDDQGAVMDRVQFLRDRAYESGRLDSMDQVHVVREREVIYIEPAVTDVVYVPYYDPWYVYGDWWWPAYPPYCWHRWHGHAVSYYGPGFYWGVGFHVAPTFYFTSFYWPQRQVVVVHDRARPAFSGRDIDRHSDFSPWRHSADRVAGMHYRSERNWRTERQDWSRPRGDDRVEERPPARTRHEPMDERAQRPGQWRQGDAQPQGRRDGAQSQWRQEERREVRAARPESRRDEMGARSPRSDREESRARWNAQEAPEQHQRVERVEVQRAERPEAQPRQEIQMNRGQERRENRGADRRARPNDR